MTLAAPNQGQVWGAVRPSRSCSRAAGNHPKPRNRRARVGHVFFSSRDYLDFNARTLAGVAEHTAEAMLIANHTAAPGSIQGRWWEDGDHE